MSAGRRGERNWWEKWVPTGVGGSTGKRDGIRENQYPSEMCVSSVTCV